MQVGETIPARVPHPDALRLWVRLSLALIPESASGLSKRVGLGRNTLGDFLTTPGRDIALSTAHVITCEIIKIAQAEGIVLPVLEVTLDD